VKLIVFKISLKNNNNNDLKAGTARERGRKRDEKTREQIPVVAN